MRGKHTNAHAFILFFFFITAVIFVYYLSQYFRSYLSNIETFQNPDPSQDFRGQAAYKRQIATISTRFRGISGKRRAINNSQIPDDEQSLVNYTALGCRITGYIGPFENGYLDPMSAVNLAAQIGCRVFVLDIDYMGNVRNARPRIVVRDRQNKSVVEPISNGSTYQTDTNSNIRLTADAIRISAMEGSMPQTRDPCIIVLNFLRIPPGSKKSDAVLNYFSAVARDLEPLYRFMLHNEPTGTYHRQSQEGRLITNPIDQYSGKVLLFCNADTSGFRDVPPGKYTANQDLDFLVNLRLFYNQSKIGCCEPAQGQVFGILEKVGDFQIIPPDRKDQIIERTKLCWTILLPNDPSQSPKETEYTKALSYGVNCIPIALWDSEETNKFMFQQRTNPLATYSFAAKPAELRFRKQRAIRPPVPSTQLNSNGGALRAPE